MCNTFTEEQKNFHVAHTFEIHRILSSACRAECPDHGQKDTERLPRVQKQKNLLTETLTMERHMASFNEKRLHWK